MFMVICWIREGMKHDLTIQELAELKEQHKLALEGYDQVELQLKDSERDRKDWEEVAKERLESARVYCDDWNKVREELIQANFEIGKLKAENADLGKDLEFTADSAKLRLDAISQYIVELNGFREENSKLKAENAALKDWQPMKEQLQKFVDFWNKPFEHTTATDKADRDDGSSGDNS